MSSFRRLLLLPSLRCLPQRFLCDARSRSGSIGKQNGEIIIDGLKINTENKTVTVDGEEIRLTSTEYKILELLARNRGRIFTADDIYRAVWNEDRIVGDKAITVHVCHIREKIEINPKETRYIKVVWGIGYKID